jgi:TATA-box binding protein (TBP) (component of TFIID and TFIIIB)
MTEACRVSTITATAHLGARVNLHALYDTLLLPEPLGEFSVVHARYMGASKGETQRKPPRPRAASRRTFDNYVTLVLDVKMNVKVFECGSVQMTGVKDVGVGRRVVERLALLVNRLACASDAHCRSYDVHLINCYFSLPIKVHRARLHRLLREAHPQLKATFDPCLNPGVRVKMSCATVMVFHSGTVMIAGAKSMEDVKRAHAFVKDFVSSNAEAVSLG